MAFSAEQREILDKFAETQPALQDKTLPYATSSLKLGTIVGELDDNEQQARSVVYDFAVLGGAVGVINLPLYIPAGSIVNGLITRAITAFASGGLATVAIKAGATTLKAATAYDDATYVGIDQQTLAAPILVAAKSQLNLTVAVAALTAGKYRIIVQYIKA